MTHQLLSVIIVAGGIGSRMKSSLPKQFLELRGKSIARYSFDLFLSLPYTAEIVVVCDPAYRSYFSSSSTLSISFAEPGERRQDSVYNGFQKLSRQDTLVCIHDAARPLLTPLIVERVFTAAAEWGAAVAGMPSKQTIKRCDHQQIVIETPNRDTLWEIQTPQIIRYDLLQAGFLKAQKENLTVTDDGALVEALGHPVKIVEGCYTNIKMTTPEDLIIAEQLLSLSYAQV